MKLRDLLRELPELLHFSGEPDTWDKVIGIFELRVDRIDWRAQGCEPSRGCT